MLCELCQTENPAKNHFCGNCGVALAAKSIPDEPVLAAPEPLPEFHVPDRPSAVSHNEVSHREDVAPPAAAPQAPASRKRPSQSVNAASSFLGLNNIEVDDDPVVYRKDPVNRHQTTISGPSFLGLTDTSETDDSDYLLEDEQPSGGRTGWIVFSVVAVAILAIVGWAEWRTISTGHLSIPGFSSNTAEGPKILPETASNSQPAITPPPSPAPPPDATNPPSNQAATPQPSGPDFESESPKKPVVAATPPPREAVGTDAANSQAPSAMASPSGSSSEGTSANKPPESSVAEKTPAPESEKPATKSRAAIPAPLTEKAPDPRQNKMLVTGENYLYGRAGLPQNCQQALVYLKAAADGENAPAMSHLGAMYASGHCVQTNRVAAYKWFVRASEADPGNQWTSRNLNMIWREMTPQERSTIAR